MSESVCLSDLFNDPLPKKMELYTSAAGNRQKGYDPKEDEKYDKLYGRPRGKAFLAGLGFSPKDNDVLVGKQKDTGAADLSISIDGHPLCIELDVKEGELWHWIAKYGVHLLIRKDKFISRHGATNLVFMMLKKNPMEVLEKDPKKLAEAVLIIPSIYFVRSLEYPLCEGVGMATGDAGFVKPENGCNRVRKYTKKTKGMEDYVSINLKRCQEWKPNKDGIYVLTQPADLKFATEDELPMIWLKKTQ